MLLYKYGYNREYLEECLQFMFALLIVVRGSGESGQLQQWSTSPNLSRKQTKVFTVASWNIQFPNWCHKKRVPILLFRITYIIFKHVNS